MDETKAGVVVPDGDVSALKQGIETLIRRPREVGAELRAWLERHERKHLSRQMISIVENAQGST